MFDQLPEMMQTAPNAEQSDAAPGNGEGGLGPLAWQRHTELGLLAGHTHSGRPDAGAIHARHISFAQHIWRWSNAAGARWDGHHAFRILRRRPKRTAGEKGDGYAHEDAPPVAFARFGEYPVLRFAGEDGAGGLPDHNLSTVGKTGGADGGATHQTSFGYAEAGQALGPVPLTTVLTGSLLQRFAAPAGRPVSTASTLVLPRATLARKFSIQDAMGRPVPPAGLDSITARMSVDDSKEGTAPPLEPADRVHAASGSFASRTVEPAYPSYPAISSTSSPQAAMPILRSTAGSGSQWKFPMILRFISLARGMDMGATHPNAEAGPAYGLARRRPMASDLPAPVLRAHWVGAGDASVLGRSFGSHDPMPDGAPLGNEAADPLAHRGANGMRQALQRLVDYAPGADTDAGGAHIRTLARSRIVPGGDFVPALPLRLVRSDKPEMPSPPVFGAAVAEPASRAEFSDASTVTTLAKETPAAVSFPVLQAGRYLFATAPASGDSADRFIASTAGNDIAIKRSALPLLRAVDLPTIGSARKSMGPGTESISLSRAFKGEGRLAQAEGRGAPGGQTDIGMAGLVLAPLVWSQDVAGFAPPPPSAGFKEYASPSDATLLARADEAAHNDGNGAEQRVLAERARLSSSARNPATSGDFRGFRKALDRTADGHTDQLVTAASRANGASARVDRTVAAPGQYVKRSVVQHQRVPESAYPVTPAISSDASFAAPAHMQSLEDEYGVVPVAGAAHANANHATNAATRSGAPGAKAQDGANVEELTEQVWRSILDKLALEQERRGFSQWP